MKKVFLVFTLVCCYLIGTAQTVSIALMHFHSGRNTAPREYWRHRDFKGSVSEIKTRLDSMDASFKIVKGILISCPNCISFESSNYPGYFLRQSDGVIILSKLNNDRDKEDASFKRILGYMNMGSTYLTPNLKNCIRYVNGQLIVGYRDLYNNIDGTFSETDGLDTY